MPKLCKLSLAVKPVCANRGWLRFLDCNLEMLCIVLRNEELHIMTRNGARSHALDGLRGMAALAVVFYHAILHVDETLIQHVVHLKLQSMHSQRDILTKIALLIFNGHTAVYIFFVLSGCVLTLSLDRKRDRPLPTIAAGFLLARAARLYPPVIACMLLFFAMGFLGIGGFPVFTPHALLQNSSLITISMHGPSTTVQAEVMAVPFLLVAWLLRRAFGPIAVVFCLAYAMLAIEAPQLVGRLPNMHAYLIAFACGMAVAEPAVRDLVSDIKPGAWWVVLGLLLLSRAFHPFVSLLTLVTMTGLCAVLVAGLLHGQRGSLARLLETAPAQSLGRVSFSFYLLNLPVLDLIWAFTDRWSWASGYALESGLCIGVLSVALTWPLAVASERWIERPAIAAGRALSAWAGRFTQKPEPVVSLDARAMPQSRPG